MIIYSQKILVFIEEIKSTIKRILDQEIRLKTSGNRFYDEKKHYSYPIKVVIYNHKTMLGYFDPIFYELGFHEGLIYSSKKQLHDIIRHELAHYITFIKYGECVASHGAEFKSFCQKMGWNEEISRATMCLDGGEIESVEESSIFRKVKKLLALGSSSNSHEAELALLKSQQLALKHNIEAQTIETREEEKVFLKRILKQRKSNAKMHAIAAILETFLVSTVYHRGQDCIYLEIVGTQTNIEIAEYVAGVLTNELDSLWDHVQKTSGLKGLVAKNSFFLGLAKGYCNKISALKREYDQTFTNAVIILEKQLAQMKELVYNRLSSGKSYAQHCATSSAIGERMGKSLNINPAVSSQSKGSTPFLIDG